MLFSKRQLDVLRSRLERYRDWNLKRYHTRLGNRDCEPHFSRPIRRYGVHVEHLWCCRRVLD